MSYDKYKQNKQLEKALRFLDVFNKIFKNIYTCGFLIKFLYKKYLSGNRV